MQAVKQKIKTCDETIYITVTFFFCLFRYWIQSTVVLVVIVVYSSYITHTRQCRIQVYNCVLFSLSQFYVHFIDKYLFVFCCSKKFHSFGDITITGLKFFTCSRHLWPLSSEGSLTCHTGQPVIKLFQRTLDTHTFCRAFVSGALKTSICPDWGSNPDLPHATRTLYHYAVV